MAKTKLVYVCSPFRATSKDPKIQKLQKLSHISLARWAGREVIRNGAVPIIPHLYFTQLLDDDDPKDRKKGMELGIQILPSCDELWVFTDGIISDGMMGEIEAAALMDMPVRMFDSDGNENPLIKDLVKVLKEKHEEPVDEEFEEEDSDEDFEACEEGDGIDSLIDSIGQRIRDFADDDSDILSIKIVK